MIGFGDFIEEVVSFCVVVRKSKENLNDDIVSNANFVKLSFLVMLFLSVFIFNCNKLKFV